MPGRPITVDWREAGPLDFRWRDAFDSALERIAEEWEVEYAQPASAETDILFVAYPAAQHQALVDDHQPLKKIANPPALASHGQLVVAACGQATPQVSEDDVLSLCHGPAVSDFTNCELIRAMRIFTLDDNFIVDALSRRLAVLQRQGVAVKVLTNTLTGLNLDFTTTEHLDY